MVAAAVRVSPQTDEWSAWYSQYFTRSASQAVRTLDLSYQVLDHVARGRLTPAAIDEALRAFAQTRGSEYTDGLTRLAERFLHGLVDVMGANGTVSGVEPVLVDRPPNGTALFQQLTRVYADLLGGFNDLRAAQIEDCLRALLTTATATAWDPSNALALIAPAGSTASASLIVENSGTEPLVVHCAVTNVRRADGVGPAFTPMLTLEPDGQPLEPGQEGRVLASLTLDADIYEPDVLYVGALQVTRQGSPHLDVPVRITATRGSR